MTKEIPLSQQQRSNSRNKGLVALVDDEDYEWLSNGGYAIRVEDGEMMLMHRQILGATGDVEVDHINGVGLDNRRANLRAATPQQNRQNRRLGSNNRTGYKGVTLDKRSGKWIMSFRMAFDSAEEAARVNDQIALIVFGDYARPNS